MLGARSCVILPVCKQYHLTGIADLADDVNQSSFDPRNRVPGLQISTDTFSSAHLVIGIIGPEKLRNVAFIVVNVVI